MSQFPDTNGNQYIALLYPDNKCTLVSGNYANTTLDTEDFETM